MFNCLYCYSLILNIRKTTLFIFKSTFLSFYIFYNNITINSLKVTAIYNYLILIIIIEVYSFINAISYLYYLIKSYFKKTNTLINYINSFKKINYYSFSESLKIIV